jgi:hypothetical protein
MANNRMTFDELNVEQKKLSLQPKMPANVQGGQYNVQDQSDKPRLSVRSIQALS